MNKRLTQTRKAELVETHNIALSLDRLQAAPYDRDRWKRSLYHAMSMSLSGHDTTLEKIRVALELP